MSSARAFLLASGFDVAAGYFVFAVIALFLALVPGEGTAGERLTLAGLLSGDPSQAAFGGADAKGVLIVLAAAATVAIPVLWKHRLAPLAFAAPLLVTLAGLWPLYVQHRRQRDAVEAMGELGQGLGELAAQMNAEIGAPLADLGIAAWALIATAVFLAFRGIARAISSSA